jgi:glycerophosphoryl diester phosphodiesterase
MNPALDLKRFNRPLLIGHRGYPARFPENTLAAFEGAIRAGCDMIELDVTLCKDRRLVVIHDDTLERTTSGKGRVRDHTLTEIKRLDAGSWFNARFAGQRVPELFEVMALAAGRCRVNIEIKTSACDADDPADAVERQVVTLVKESDSMDRVIVSSFDRGILERIAAIEAPPPLAFISERPLDSGVLDFLLAIKAFSHHPRFSTLDRAQVERLHAAGLNVFPWTINTRKEAEELLALGVDGLICNELLIMRSV